MALQTKILHFIKNEHIYKEGFSDENKLHLMFL